MSQIDKENDKIEIGDKQSFPVKKDGRSRVNSRDDDRYKRSSNDRSFVVDKKADVHVKTRDEMIDRVDIRFGENTHLTINIAAGQPRNDERPVIQRPKDSRWEREDVRREQRDARFDEDAHVKKYHAIHTLGQNFERYYIEITIPEGVTELPDYALRNSVIISMKLPLTLKKIGCNCFENTVFNMNHVGFPENLDTIGEEAFSGASGKNIELPYNVRKLKANTFYNSRFKTIVCKGVKVISYSCFSHININTDDNPCTLLLGNVVRIKNSAFADSRIRIPALSSTINEIGGWCFAGSNVELDYFGNLNSNLTVLRACTFLNCNILSIKIPTGVTMIGDGCFANCINLYDVEIPDTVKELGYFCFYHCINLEQIVLPANVLIGCYCFYYCAKLEKVWIGRKRMNFEIKYSVYKNDPYWDSMGVYKDGRYSGYPNVVITDYEYAENTSFSLTNLAKDVMTSKQLIRGLPPNHAYSERRDDYLFDFDWKKNERESREEEPENAEGDETEDYDDDLEYYDELDGNDNFVEVVVRSVDHGGDKSFCLNQNLMKKNRTDDNNLLVDYDEDLNTREGTDFVNRGGYNHEKIFQAMLKMFEKSIMFGFPFDENSFAQGYTKDNYPEDVSRTFQVAIQDKFK